MLTDLHDNPIVEQPPVGHSISTASTPESAQKGSISSGGPLSPTSKPISTYAKFAMRRLIQEKALQKAQKNDQLVDRLMRRLDTIDTYLTDDEVFFAKLEEAKLRDIAVLEGIYIDKLQALTGQATTIIGVQHQDKIDQVLPLLLQVMQQRGLTMTATERKVEVAT